MSVIPAPAVGVRARGRVPVAIALARVETRKLLRHPASIVGILVGLPITVAATWHDVPVLNRHDGLTYEALIPFACGLLMAAHVATMRARRYRTTELFDSLVAAETSVTAGLLIAVASVAALSLVLVVAQLAYMQAIGGITTPRPEVLFIGPALVAFGGALGVALGRWAPRLFSAPLGLVGVVAICTALSFNAYDNNRDWLSLWIPSESWGNIAGEVSLRPYGWRLLYLCGLAAVVAMVAIGRDRRRRPVAIALALALAFGTAYAAKQQLTNPSRNEQIALAAQAVRGFERHSCHEFASVNYCALTGYESWIDRWRAPIEGVLASAPSEARLQDFRVVQTPSPGELFDAGRNDVLSRRVARAIQRGTLSTVADVRPSLSWGRNSSTGKYELILGLAAAIDMTRFDTHVRISEADLAETNRPRRLGLEVGDTLRRCSSLDQGRSIVALWLAAQATDGTALWLRNAVGEIPYVVEFDPSGTTFFAAEQYALDNYWWELNGDDPPVLWGTRDATYAAHLLEQNQSTVRADIAANWERLTDPETTSDEAAAMMGLELLAPIDQVLKNWKQGPYSSIKRQGIPQCQ